jgi:diguanylate cyclase (GGDEF)-like protein
MTYNALLSGDALDRLMPMHLLVSKKGTIQHVGPTLKKICRDLDLVDQDFFDVFSVARPKSVSTMTDLLHEADQKLTVQARQTQSLKLRGLIVEIDTSGCVLLNLSFGISVVEASRSYSLSGLDFAPTDLAAELLYLVEANAAVMSEWQKLNTKLDRAKLVAEKQAFTDALTGLKNRRALDVSLGHFAEDNVPFALMNVDLDYFKAVNDSLGHAAGDSVLKNVAHILTEETRDVDVVARVGGDEFVLVFRNLIDKKRLTDIARRIISRLEQPIRFQDETCSISASIGTSLSTSYRDVDLDEMLEDADRALYKSKEAGRARVTFACSA